MKTFRHSHQLIQLERLDPVAHAKAKALVTKTPRTAARVIIAAMHAARQRLSQPQSIPANLLTLAQQTIATKPTWYSGKTVTIWRTPAGQSAWLRNASGGWITLTLFQDAKRLTDRRYSPALLLAYFDPQQGQWVLVDNVDYEAWLNQAAKKMVAR